MTISSAIRTVLVGLAVLAYSTSASLADSGYVTLTIYKAGWIIGGSGGSGTSKFRGRTYRLSTGGVGLRSGLRRLEDGAARWGPQYQQAIGRRGRLWRGRCGACRGGWRARNCVDQPERRRLGTERQAGGLAG